MMVNMKCKVLLFATLMTCSFAFLSLFPNNATADYCSPTAPYTNCYEHSAYGASAKIQTTDIYSYSYENKNYFYETRINVRCDGDKFYLYDGDTSPNCGAHGCLDAISTIQTETDTTYDFAGFKDGIQPNFICWDNGSDGWVYATMSWVDTFYPQIKECSSDDGCAVNEYCNNSNPYEVTCDELNCSKTEKIINHTCVPEGLNLSILLLLTGEKD